MKQRLLIALAFLLPFLSFGQGEQLIIRSRSGGVQQIAAVPRDVISFPFNATGNTDYVQAINSGLFNFSLVNSSGQKTGQVIAGTNVGPADYSARFTKTNTSLTIEGAPRNVAGVKVKLETALGVANGLKSKDGQTLSLNTPYPSGTLNGQGKYVQEWSFVNSNGMPDGLYTVTFVYADNRIFTKTFTATTAVRKRLFVSASGLELAEAVSSGTSPPTSGTVTPPNNNNNPSPAPVITSLTPFTDQGWSGEDMKYIENSVIKVGFKRSVGATFCYAARKADNRNVVNDLQIIYDDKPEDPRYGKIISEKGRQWMLFSHYYSPNPVPDGFQITTASGEVKDSRIGYKGHVFNTGGNDVQGGNLWPAMEEGQVISSAIINDSRGQVFRAKVRGRIWAFAGEWGHIVGDMEVWLDGNTICWVADHIVEDRPSNWSPPRYIAREQEVCAYVLAPFTAHRANINGQIVDRFPYGWTPNAPFSNTVYTSGCWMGAYEGPDGQGVTLYSPENSAFRSGQFVSTNGIWSSNDCSYLDQCPQWNLDEPGTRRNRGFMILGTMNEALAKIQTLPPINQDFDFDFSGVSHLWANGDCRGKRESGGTAFYLGDKNQDNGYFGRVHSPSIAWQASGIPSISVDMSVHGMSKVWLTWKKPGEDNDNSTYFRKAVDVTGDGQRRTYTFSMSDPNFNGTISNIGFAAICTCDGTGHGLPQTPEGSKIILYRVKKN